MELFHNIIHMENTKGRGILQIPIEEDKNLPDQCPDMDSILLTKCNPEIREIRSFTDYVMVHGEITYEILYHTEEVSHGLASLKGAIPLEEKINMEGITSMDQVEVSCEVEDFRTRLINSRKLGIQAVLAMTGECHNLEDTQLLTGVQGEEKVECAKQKRRFTKLAVGKKDVYRIKEEIQLPSAYPNIEKPLFCRVLPGDLEYTLQTDRIQLSGELQVFYLYQGEGEEDVVRSFEKWIPIKGSLECAGVKEEDVPYIVMKLGQVECSARPDMDGEQRSLFLDVSLDLDLHIYRDEELETITDLYSISHEVTPVFREKHLQLLRGKRRGKMKLAEKMKVPETEENLLQVLYAEGSVWMDSHEVTEEGIQIKGSVMAKALCITGKDRHPYVSLEKQIPFRYLLRMEKVQEEDIVQIVGSAEHMEVSMQGDEELELKCVVDFDVLALQEEQVSCITEVSVEPLDQNRIRSLPGMCIYVVSGTERIWDIGKRYHTTTERIMELNELSTTELKPGQKLLLCKTC